MNPIWHTTLRHLLLTALVATGALVWPAIAAADAPAGTYTFNGHTFNTENAVMTLPVTGGTAYIYDSGYTFNWSDYWGKFTSSNNGSRWWAYRGTVTNDAKQFRRGCGRFVQHRRGEFQIENGYRWSCRAGAAVAAYVVRYKKAPPRMRCLKRANTFYCSRFIRGRQTVKFTYRTAGQQKIRRAINNSAVRECGAVSTTSGTSGKPGKYVVFARNDQSCVEALSDHDAIMGMAAYTAMKGAPGGDYHSIGTDRNMRCFKIGGTDSMLACTGGNTCVVLSRFSKGRFPRVYDEWAWSGIVTARFDPFQSC